MTADTKGLRAAAVRRYGALASAGAAALQAELRVRAPHDTYELRDSITVKARRVGEATFRITADAPVIQAATTNTGARPHVIRPRRAKMLRFNVGGRVVFARVVHHPGNRGTHWWDKVIERRSAIIGRAFGRL